MNDIESLANSTKRLVGAFRDSRKMLAETKADPLTEARVGELAAEFATRAMGTRRTILVAGVMKAGKSTLVNALVSRSLLPARSFAMTILPTAVVHVKEAQIPNLSLPLHKTLNLSVAFIRGCMKARRMLAIRDARSIWCQRYDKILAEWSKSENGEGTVAERLFEGRLFERENRNEFLEIYEGAEASGNALMNANLIVRMHMKLKKVFDPIDEDGAGGERDDGSLVAAMMECRRMWGADADFEAYMRLDPLHGVTRETIPTLHIHIEAFAHFPEFVSLTIMDTPGPNEAAFSESLRELCLRCYKEADCVLIVTQSATFESSEAAVVVEEMKAIMVESEGGKPAREAEGVDEREERSELMEEEEEEGEKKATTNDVDSPVDVEDDDFEENPPAKKAETRRASPPKSPRATTTTKPIFIVLSKFDEIADKREDVETLREELLTSGAKIFLGDVLDDKLARARVSVVSMKEFNMGVKLERRVARARQANEDTVSVGREYFTYASVATTSEEAQLPLDYAWEIAKALKLISNAQAVFRLLQEMALGDQMRAVLSAAQALSENMRVVERTSETTAIAVLDEILAKQRKGRGGFRPTLEGLTPIRAACESLETTTHHSQISREIFQALEGDGNKFMTSTPATVRFINFGDAM